MSRVRVRMYRQGLGDCFLLSFPSASGEVHVLIDCGVLKGTEDAQERIRLVAQNIMTVTGGHVAVLVVTHEHWDHVSGFLQAEDVFEELTIDEVWLAWTENPEEDEDARKLRERRQKTFDTVEKAAQKLRALSVSGESTTATRIEGLLQFFGAAGRKTTARGIAWAKQRKKHETPFLEPGSEPRTIPGLDRVRVYVLGPPRDVKLLKKSDPSRRDSEVYELGGDAGAGLGFLAAVNVDEPAAAMNQQPFDGWFRMSEEEARNDPFFQEHYAPETEAWRQIEDDWLGTAGGLALKLDSDTNNTSLALAFELVGSGRVLLFPGDAQVGNWLSWEGLEWKIKENGETKTVTARDLLARTVLYKVGHHGSHNATLRDSGLELMSSSDLIVLLPVERATAKKLEWKMPFPALHRRLLEKSKGRVLDRDDGLPTRAAVTLNDRDWEDFTGRVGMKELWLDCWIDL